MNSSHRSQARIAARLISAEEKRRASCLTDDALHRNMMAFGKKLAKNPEAARAFLQRAGIVRGDGTLAKDYGG